MGEEALAVGSLFDDRYEIRAVAGHGGMATVYRAFHRDLGREVALKILHANRAIDTDQIRRFQLEAHLVFNLSHPNITSVNAFGTFDGAPYVAFEFLHGTSLADVVKQSGPLPFARFVRLLMQVCDGLQFAHIHGVIHRDLKPANIFVVDPDTDKETAKIVDFGIAKALPNTGVSAQKLTSTGEIIGTPLYMSPEQSSTGQVDARSDIYSLGCVMFYCLMAKPPFDGETPYEVLYAHDYLEAPPVVPPAGYPDGIAEIIAKCLEKKADDRYQSCDELKGDLSALQSGKKLFERKKTNQSRPIASGKFAVISALIVACGVLAPIGLYCEKTRVVQHFFERQNLRRDWEKGKFDSLTAALNRAYETGDSDWAGALISEARPALQLHPSVEGARVYITALQCDESGSIEQNPIRDERRKSALRIIRSLPEADIAKDSTIDALVQLSIAGKGQKSERDEARSIRISMELADWAWERAVRGQHDASLAIAKRSISLIKPKSPIAYHHWRKLLSVSRDAWMSGSFADARFILDLLVSQPISDHGKSAHAESLLMKAEILASEGNDAGCLQQLHEAEKLTHYKMVGNEKVADVAFELSMAYRELGQTDRFGMYLNRLFQICEQKRQEQDSGLALQYASLIGDVHALRGEDNFAQFHYLRTLQLFQESYTQPPPRRPGVEFSIAHATLNTNQAIAHDLFKKYAATWRTHNGSVYFRWVKVALEQPKIEEALDLIKPAQVNPAQLVKIKLEARRLINLAGLHAAAGRFRSAAMDFAQLADMLRTVDQSVANRSAVIGAQYAESGGLAESAAGIYDQILKQPNLQPADREDALAYKARYLRRHGQIRQGQGLLLEALAASKDASSSNHHALVCEGTLSFAQTRDWDRVKAFTELISVDLDDKNYFVCGRPFEVMRRWGDARALVLRHAGKLVEADALLDKVAKMDKDLSDHYDDERTKLEEQNRI